MTKSVDKVKKAGRKAVLLRLEDGKGDMRFVAVPLTGNGHSRKIEARLPGRAFSLSA